MLEHMVQGESHRGHAQTYSTQLWDAASRAMRRRGELEHYTRTGVRPHQLFTTWCETGLIQAHKHGEALGSDLRLALDVRSPVAADAPKMEVAEAEGFQLRCTTAACGGALSPLASRLPMADELRGGAACAAAYDAHAVSGHGMPKHSDTALQAILEASSGRGHVRSLG